MKYLLLSLLLLNLLYALWQLQEKPAAVVMEAPAVAASASARSAAVSANDAAAQASLPLDPTALCVTLGQFAARAQAQSLRQRLLALDLQSRVLERKRETSTEYWLVLAVVGTEQQALMQLSALQEQGVDSFLITRGQLAGNLSLGVFAQEGNARARQQQLQVLGRDVRLHALSKIKSEFVVEVASTARRLVDQPLLSRLREDFPVLQHRYEICQGVANSVDIP